MSEIFETVTSGEAYANFGRPCRGLNHPDGCCAITKSEITWLVETEIHSALEEQYFIARRRGKSWRKWLADFPKIISQKSRYLILLWSDLGEKLPGSR